MRDEDDILFDIKHWEKLKNKYKDEPHKLNIVENMLIDLQLELNEYRFTHGEKVYEPKRENEESDFY